MCASAHDGRTVLERNNTVRAVEKLYFLYNSIIRRLLTILRNVQLRF